MNIDNIWTAFMQILIAGGGSAAVAYYLFTKFGEKWLDKKFAERLEALRYAQNRELEHYRYEINALFNRVTKIHEKEFEVLPVVWEKLQMAFGRVLQFTSAYQEYPDINSMNNSRMEETLARTDFSESQKDEIRQAEDKTKTFINITFWHNLNQAHNAVTDFHNYFAVNKIFLGDELFESLTEADNFLRDALDKRELLELDRNAISSSEAYMTNRSKIQPLLSKIEGQIRHRLRYEDAG